METTDLRTLNWRKSSRSGTRSGCVEVAHTSHAVAVRDSKDPGGPALLVSRAGFARFLNSLR
jgi:hypothetical protein